MSYGDRFRFVVEDVHGNILTRDLVAQEVTVLRMLSGPCQIQFKIHPKDPSVQLPNSGGPIQFKPWGHWIHALKEDQQGNEMVWASGIFQPSEIDPESGVLQLKAEGFSLYPKGLPWLENWNPIAVDPFEIVERIWHNLQDDYDNGNLGVTVTNEDGSTPPLSGTQMLPGFSFNNEEFVQDFFAIFIRAIDRLDSGDYINTIARDIPFDYWETSAWNEGRTAINKSIRLAYPHGGVDQTDLVFRMGENVSAATQKQEQEIEWFSDIVMNGFFPGKVYSAKISNADPDRYRRTLDETDLHLDSNERAKAWAFRKLTRRQFPNQYDSIIIEPYHPHAPFSSFDVGDTILTQGVMPWVGEIKEPHRVMAIGFDEGKATVEVKLMAEGAFNYDPIVYGVPE